MSGVELGLAVLATADLCLKRVSHKVLDIPEVN